MRTCAVRLYGIADLRLEEFELPQMKDDEILAKVVCDSLCTSSYKASKIGAAHKRIPNNIAQKPIILGHEFCGEILEVGRKWQSQFKPHDKFSIQPALNYKGTDIAPGYSFQYIGGDATYVIIPNVVMEQHCLLKYEGAAYFLGALSEPVSCVVGGFNAMYHIPQGTYIHTMGLKEGGSLALLAGTGPMGLVAIDYCVHAAKRSKKIVVTSRNKDKLAMSQQLFSPKDAKKHGIELIYLHTQSDNKKNKQAIEKEISLTISQLKNIEPNGFDDVLVMAPSVSLTQIADAVLARGGCLNFFAGPTDNNFNAPFNFYNVHYNFTHVTSNSGGNTDDMREALNLIEKNIINPAAMVTHIGGLDQVVETTQNLPNLPGSKKLIYTHKKFKLTALKDLQTIASNTNGTGTTKTSATGAAEYRTICKELSKIIKTNNGVWSIEAENYFLTHAPNIN